jgi:hypothetical protein
MGALFVLIFAVACVLLAACSNGSTSSAPSSPRVSRNDRAACVAINNVVKDARAPNLDPQQLTSDKESVGKFAQHADDPDLVNQAAKWVSDSDKYSALENVVVGDGVATVVHQGPSAAQVQQDRAAADAANQAVNTDFLTLAQTCGSLGLG